MLTYMERKQRDQVENALDARSDLLENILSTKGDTTNSHYTKAPVTTGACDNGVSNHMANSTESVEQHRDNFLH